jgi:hypothetical protein
MVVVVLLAQPAAMAARRRDAVRMERIAAV